MGDAIAEFTDGDTIIRDALPSTNISYGPVVAGPATGVTGSVSCSITTNVLECTATAGDVTIAAGGDASFGFPATASVAGTYDNPTGGVCRVDPDAVDDEMDENNNDCADSVVVVPAGSITIVKSTIGGDDTFSFTSASSIGDFDVTTVGNTGQKLFSDLLPGTYDLTETVPAGWSLTGSSCNDDSTLPNIEIDPSEDVICTFENTQLGSITVVKNTVGGDDTFSFTSASSIGNFDVTTASNTGQELFAGLLPGSYDIAETPLAGWFLTGSSCDDDSTLPNIELAAGENVICTFENTQPGSIRVVKNTVGSDATFSFTSTSSIGNFDVTTASNTGQKLFTDLLPGTYDIAETPLAGWSLTGSSCDDGSTLSNIALAANENVTCTVENTQLGSITVVKNTLGIDATFGFTSTSSIGNFDVTTASNTGQKLFTGLLPGTYDIAETPLAGWSLTGSNCNDGSTLPNVVLAAGENVTCSFENTQLGSITVVKNTIGGDATFSFTSASSIGNFDVTTVSNTGQEYFVHLLPGTYDIAETPTAGWSLTGSSCDDGSTLPNVDVAVGENVICSFENTQDDPQLTLTKSATPASYTLLGDNVSYSLLVENKGNVALTNVTVTDPLTGLGAIDCDSTGSNILANLAAAASADCEAMYSITQADLDAGSVTNQASVTAKDPSDNDVTAASNPVTISKLVDVCYDGALTIPDGMVFSGAGTTTYSSTLSIDTEAPATAGVMVEAPHTLILKAQTVAFNQLFDVEGDVDVNNPPGGGQLRVIIGPISCPGTP